MKTRREVLKSGAAIVEGDIETARKAFRFYQEQIIEGAHEELRGLRIGINSSKVEPA